jgi:hypothetical protein
MLPRKAVFESRLRANQRFQFVPKDSLSCDEKKALAHFHDYASFSGILKPGGNIAAGIKTISSDVAHLWRELMRPQTLPAWARLHLGPHSQSEISRLVYDAILEIEAGQDFFSGAEAWELLSDDPAPLAGSGFIATLSQRALEYGQALDLDSANILSARLYFFNRVPASPMWTRRFPDSQVVAEHLGLDARRRFKGSGQRRWSPVADLPDSQGGWFKWNSRERRKKRAGYKLYVSPACEPICEALRKAIILAAETSASAFKVGKDVFGLLRPDKLVVYFDAFEDLKEAARLFERELSGFPAHGVPFSAALTDDGLLSWGIDPPPERLGDNWQAESWRLWVTNRLATALIQAKTAQLGKFTPWQFAMARLRLDGVDTNEWAPQPDFLLRNGNHHGG